MLPILGNIDTRDQYPALVNTVMNLRVKMVGNTSIAELLLASQEGLSSMELLRMTYPQR
jgi:hypothetical protein